MAQKVQVTIVDDIDGGEATETIPFGIDGVQYEIDLNDKHALELRAAVEKFAAHARRTGGRKKAAAATNGVAKKGTKVNGTKVTLGPSSREIRDWARSNGFDVPERGRVPGTVLDAFQAAH